MAAGRDPTDSGVSLYPRLPVPSSHGGAGDRRDSSPRTKKPSWGAASRKRLVLGVVGGLVVGAVVGFVARPSVAPDPRVADLGQKVSTAESALAAEKSRADGLAAEVAAEKARAAKVAQALGAASDKLAAVAAEGEKKSRSAAELEEKLSGAIEKGTASVNVDGDDVHVVVLEKQLFKPGDDALTDGGKKLLDRLATALKELPDEHVWVQGHTDDQPLAAPAAPKVVPKKGAKPAAVVAPVAAVRFETNWELSSARALAVVHYLQDVAKLEPTRLASLAFGQYKPVSKANKALNRRIEIVVGIR